jgi:hypothetical protein
MSYILNKTDGTVLVTLADGVVDTSTSLSLIGRNTSSYGERQNENFIKLLENFANSAEPPGGDYLAGQIWYDSTASIKQLKVYNGSKWLGIGSITKASPAPGSLIRPLDPTSVYYDNGDLWYNTTTRQIYINDNSIWKLVGPLAPAGINNTEIIAEIITDTFTVDHVVLSFYINGSRLAMFSPDEVFTPAVAQSGYATIKSGLNFNTGFSNVTVSGLASINISGTATVGNVVSGGTLLVNGNATIGNISTGAGSFSGAITGSTTLNITGNATVGNLTTAGRITSATSTVTGNATIGNISTGAGSFSGAITGSTTLNITGNATVGSLVSGSAAFSGPITGTSTIGITGNATVGNLSASSIVGTLTTPSQPLITTVGTLNGLNVTGALVVSQSIRSTTQITNTSGGTVSLSANSTNHQLNITGAVSLLTITDLINPGQLIRIMLIGTEHGVTFDSSNNIYWPNNSVPNFTNGTKGIAIVTLTKPSSSGYPITSARTSNDIILATYVSY